MPTSKELASEFQSQTLRAVLLLEKNSRLSRTRFRYPIRVVTLEGEPKVIHALTGNVSTTGLFVRMDELLPSGTKVALSLEAGGRALALAQAEVMWASPHGPGRSPGCGVRFTEFLHPRAQELVDYLVKNLDRGKPLVLPRPPRSWMPGLLAAGLAVLVGGGVWMMRPSNAVVVVEAPVHEVAAAPVAVVAPAPVVVEEPAEEVFGGVVGLPSGTAPRLAWTLVGNELRLTPDLPGRSKVSRAFIMTGPPRAIFDLRGPRPKRSHTVPVSVPYATGIRVGAQVRGTRIVIQLARVPKTSKQDGGALVLSF